MQSQADFDTDVCMGFLKASVFGQHINMLTAVLDSALVSGLFLLLL